MIAGIFHKGSGLGNQLHRYVMTRVLAIDKGTDFGMVNPQNFKGASFMKLDMGKPVTGLTYEYHEKTDINEDGNEVRDYDWNGILRLKDGTLVDGEFQGEKYYEHHLDKIQEWLQTPTMVMPDNTCIMAFRGGEYVGVPGLFLPLSYWLDAMVEIRQINPDVVFRVVTDDVATAQAFFMGLDITISHEIGQDWMAIRHAPYLILSNSSFGILPALLNKNAKKIYAPKFWAGYNKGYWQLKQNQYKKFTFI